MHRTHVCRQGFARTRDTLAHELGSRARGVHLMVFARALARAVQFDNTSENDGADAAHGFMYFWDGHCAEAQALCSHRPFDGSFVMQRPSAEDRKLKPPLPTKMAEVSIKRSMAVYGGGLSRPWRVDEVTIIDGTEFVELSLADKGFVAFVFGKDSKGSRNPDYLQKLKDLRTAATIKIAQARPEGNELFDDAPEIGRRESKRRRADGKAAGTRGDLPKFIVIEAPGVAKDGVVGSSLSLKVKPAIDRWSNLHCEATVVSLAFIRGAVLSTQKQAGGAPACPKGVHWRSDRRCFVATNKVGKLKAFRPEGDDAESVSIAVNNAAAWVDGDAEEY